MARGGRPTKYKKELCEEAIKLARKGLMVYQIAKSFGISNKTLYNWANKYPEFKEAINECHEIVINEVEGALFKSALGYDVEETEEREGDENLRITKRRHIPVNDRAAKWILSNKRPNEWREKQTIEHTGNANFEVIVIGDDGDEEE